MKRKIQRTQKHAELNLLKGELRAQKITYRDLAPRLGRSVGWLSDMLNGFSSPDVEEMLSICAVVGIKEDQIERFFISPNISKRNNERGK